MPAEVCVTAAAVMALILAGCASQGAGKPIDTNDQPKIVEASDVNVIQVPHPEQFPLVSVDLREGVDELKVTGAVSPDVSLAVPVNALVSGRVAEIKARLGDTVHKGDVLLIVNSQIGRASCRERV